MILKRVKALGLDQYKEVADVLTNSPVNGLIGESTERYNWELGYEEDYKTREFRDTNDVTLDIK